MSCRRVGIYTEDLLGKEKTARRIFFSKGEGQRPQATSGRGIPPLQETPPHLLRLTVFAETSVVPRTVLGLEGRLHVEEGTLLVAVP